MTSSPVSARTTVSQGFGELLRQWRHVRRVSQLNLSLDAEISTRHLSYIETGRAQPSREMVLRLAEVLEVPLRERNALLLAAGFAPVYRQAALAEPELKAARHAVEHFMAQLEPYPVLVLDRYWNTLSMNAAAKRFLAMFPGCDTWTPHNGVRLVFHPQGLRPFIDNWEMVATRILQRVHREVADNPTDGVMKRFLQELQGYPGVPNRSQILDADCTPPPFLTIDYKYKGSTLRLFSMLTTLGTPMDVSLQEIRIESFFPADDATRIFLIDATA